MLSVTPLAKERLPLLWMSVHRPPPPLHLSILLIINMSIRNLFANLL